MRLLSDVLSFGGASVGTLGIVGSFEVGSLLLLSSPICVSADCCLSAVKALMYSMAIDARVPSSTDSSETTTAWGVR